MRRVRLLAWLVAAICTAATVSAQVTTGSIVGTVSDTQGQVVPGATVAIKEVGKQTVDDGRHRRQRRLHRAVPQPRHLRGRGRAHRLQEVRPPGHHRAGQPARPRRRQPRGRPAHRGDTTVIAAAPLVRTDSSEVGTVIEEKAIQRAAAERPQLRDAGLPRRPASRPARQGENLSGASTFNPRGASNFNALGQQANTNGWLDRRHRQQRVHLQHRHHRAVGRAGARVQGPDRRLLGRVRPRRRRRLGRRPSRAATCSTAPCSSSCATTPSTRTTSSPQRARADGTRGAEAAAPPPPVRRRRRRAAVICRALRRAQPDVLLRRLRRPEGDARPVVRQHRADRAARATATSATSATPAAA